MRGMKACGPRDAADMGQASRGQTAPGRDLDAAGTVASHGSNGQPCAGSLRELGVCT